MHLRKYKYCVFLGFGSDLLCGRNDYLSREISANADWRVTSDNPSERTMIEVRLVSIAGSRTCRMIVY